VWISLDPSPPAFSAHVFGWREEHARDGGITRSSCSLISGCCVPPLPLRRACAASCGARAPPGRQLLACIARGKHACERWGASMRAYRSNKYTGGNFFRETVSCMHRIGASIVHKVRRVHANSVQWHIAV
jgi:hypothetical protein